MKKVLKKKFKRIESVTGPTKIGSDGVTLYWDEVLADGPFKVFVSAIDEGDDDENFKELTTEFKARNR